jgi:hypothetical protein
MNDRRWRTPPKERCTAAISLTRLSRFHLKMQAVVHGVELAIRFRVRSAIASRLENVYLSLLE